MNDSVDEFVVALRRTVNGLSRLQSYVVAEWGSVVEAQITKMNGTSVLIFIHVPPQPREAAEDRNAILETVTKLAAKRNTGENRLAFTSAAVRWKYIERR